MWDAIGMIRNFLAFFATRIYLQKSAGFTSTNRWLKVPTEPLDVFLFNPYGMQMLPGIP